MVYVGTCPQVGRQKLYSLHRAEQGHRLCCRVATDVTIRFWTCSEYNVHNVWMHTCTWRVCDDNVRTSMLTDKILCQNVFHVTCIEKRVINLINPRVYFCILYSLWNIFNTNYFLSFLCYEVCNCTRTV